MSLIDNLLNPGASVFYEDGFRIVFEDHLNFILKDTGNIVRVDSIDPNTGARFTGDWRGLMLELSVSPYMHWFNMRINGYSSNYEYDGSLLKIAILNNVVIDRMANQYRTKRKK